MQGTVWGSLSCTSTMDQLSKLSYRNPEELFKYKGVPIPPLEMVDDILTVTNVGKTLTTNKLVNTFIESKRLKLSDNKCAQIHIGGGHTQCPILKVHDQNMKTSIKEKYLGDYIESSGKIQATIDHRKEKANGIISEITSIVNDIPFGKYRMEVALKLRESMLINGILYNSEAWHGVTKKHIKELEALDEALLRKLLNAHSKTPSEFLYLETGALPLRWLLAQRRIIFMKHIMMKHDNELVKKVFMAQKHSPNQSDFVTLVTKDLSDLNISYEEVTSENISKYQLKKKLKLSALSAALKQLKEELSTHTKLRHISYPKLEMQSYLGSEVLTLDEIHQLTAFRSQCVRGVRTHFRKMYPNLFCPLKCNIITPHDDTSDHIINCSKLPYDKSLPQNISQVYESIQEQERIAVLLSRLMRQRKKILEDIETTNALTPSI